MTEPDVCLTDYALAVECLCLTWQVSRMHHGSQLRWPFTVFFFSVAIAAAAGGTVHGFFLDQKSLGFRVLWPFTLIMMGVTAVSGVYIGSALLCSQSNSLLVERFALVAFAAYTLIVLFVRHDFLIAILGYAPALVWAGAGFLSAYLSRMGLGFLWGFLGVCTMGVAAAMQQAKIGFNARYFGYNAVYHLLQALALFLIFLAASASGSAGETIQ